MAGSDHDDAEPVSHVQVIGPFNHSPNRGIKKSIFTLTRSYANIYLI